MAANCALRSLLLLELLPDRPPPELVWLLVDPEPPELPDLPADDPDPDDAEPPE